MNRMEVYPVGIFSDIKRKRAWNGIRYYLLERMFEGDWRSARNYFNGYLAEWTHCDETLEKVGAGRGWTQKRAKADLLRKTEKFWKEYKHE